jgi:hypothetical protein
MSNGISLSGWLGFVCAAFKFHSRQGRLIFSLLRYAQRKNVWKNTRTVGANGKSLAEVRDTLFWAEEEHQFSYKFFSLNQAVLLIRLI